MRLANLNRWFGELQPEQRAVLMDAAKSGEINEDVIDVLTSTGFTLTGSNMHDLDWPEGLGESLAEKARDEEDE